MINCAAKLLRRSASITIVCALSFVQASAQTAQREGALAQLQEARAQLVQSQQLLDQLTTTYGRLDPRLLESLTQHSNQLSEIGEYESANDFLDQAIQITRFSEGLYVWEQLPLQFSKLSNLINSNNWRKANQLIESLQSLLNLPENVADEEYIEASLRLADFHLQGVASDHTTNQSRHIKAAGKIIDRTITIATIIWGRYDLRLPAILYKRVVQLNLQARAVEVGGPTGLTLRAYAAWGPARSRQTARLQYYVTGLARLNQIKNIYLNQENSNPTAVALADVYIGDWQVLFSMREEAEAAYLRSYYGFRNANIDQQEINRFFHAPISLPTNIFHSDWQKASAALNVDYGQEPDSGAIASLKVAPWSASFSHVSSPFEFDEPAQQNNNPPAVAEFLFTLTGLEKIVRWHRGQYITSISTAKELRLMQADISNPQAQFELEARVKGIRFRPRLIDGVAQAVSAKLSYQLL